MVLQSVVSQVEAFLQEKEAERLQQAATRAMLEAAEGALAHMHGQLQGQTKGLQQLMVNLIQQQQVIDLSSLIESMMCCECLSLLPEMVTYISRFCSAW